MNISSRGLSEIAAQKLLSEHGFNVLPEKQADPWWRKFIKQFSDIMVIILLIAAFVAFLLNERLDSTLIFAIVIANSLIGFFQEWRSEKTLEALKNMVSPEATVIRDGKEQLLPARLLVPGDLVILREGDRIPADIRLIESSELKVEEAALTGESEPVLKAENAEVYLGTAVVYGSAEGLVFATGGQTKFGNVARLTLATKAVKSPLEHEISTIGLFVGKLAFVLIAGIFALDFFLNGAGFFNAILFSISVAVAAVPEGLPATITIALALGVQRLAQKNAVVKQLSSAETLGATTVICSDKTGTITKNEMTVLRGLLANGAQVIFDGVGKSTFGSINFSAGDAALSAALLAEMLAIAVNCNEAKLAVQPGTKVIEILGDPTEGALLVAGNKFLRAFPRIKVPHLNILKKFPFEARRKMMSVAGKLPTGEMVLFTKGAPEMILAACTKYFDGTKIQVLTPAKRRDFSAQVEGLSAEALRVLAFARKELSSGIIPTDPEDAEKELTFYGLLGMIDPPREAVPAAVAAAHTAGIRIIMVTGDNPKTAAAIARSVGLVRSPKLTVITGLDLQKMSDAKLQQALFTKLPDGKNKNSRAIYQDVLFARTAPEDKLRIVALLQKHGAVVAVTGDGVNDAPALKKANIGVAMGIAGTEVAKEAAHLVLLDDSFATIVTAIREGRKIFENLRKFIWFLFSGNIGELIVVLTALLFSIPNPLTAVLILLINLGTDLLPAVALSFEKAEEGIMAAEPRNPKARILSRRFALHFFANGVVLAASTMGAFFWLLYQNGWHWGLPVGDELHRHVVSTCFAVLVLGQMFIGLSARHFYASAFTDFFGNTKLLGAILLSVIMVFAVIYIPLLQGVFHTAHLTFLEMGTAVLFSSAVFWFEELRKVLKRVFMKPL